MASFTLSLAMLLGLLTTDSSNSNSETNVAPEATVESEALPATIEGLDLDRNRLEYVSRLA